MSVVTHAIWPVLVPWLRAKRVDHDRGRYRLEVDTPDTPTQAIFFAARMPCVYCGTVIQFIRPRKQKSERVSIFLAVTCQTDKPGGTSCRNSGAARREYARIVAAKLKWIDPQQPSLFDAGVTDVADADIEDVEIGNGDDDE